MSPATPSTLSATASDDFGVSNVTFFDGRQRALDRRTAAIRHDVRDPREADPAATAPSRRSRGIPRARPLRTASRSPSMTSSTAKARRIPPTISFDPPTPTTIPSAGLAVSVTAESESGVDQVEFFLGTRSVCVDDTAPYTCNVLPNGDEVGDQILSAVVTSTDEQTANVATACHGSEVRPGYDARDVQGAPLEEEREANGLGRDHAAGARRRRGVHRHRHAQHPARRHHALPELPGRRAARLHVLPGRSRSRRKRRRASQSRRTTWGRRSQATEPSIRCPSPRCSVHDPPLRQYSDSKVGK